ncbi:hypothetical protein BG015_008582 [Linnemannia schmuckeri]|uniref:Uncharacterized protein n=1 Tax=Linnemannia schmuckeri TaxID=64567 RepID=A0A9P5VA75_9FUNG|nr:hypothetical protein BG015_008582 [Linnemannia schmuckeri]
MFQMLASQLPSHSLGQLPKVNPQYAHFSKVFPILMRCFFINTFRQNGLHFKVFQPVIMGVIVAIYFTPLDNKPSDVVSRFDFKRRETKDVLRCA